MLAQIPLAAIQVDRSISLRLSDCQATIRRYARALGAGDHFPAVDVCVDDDGQYWLADGFLRYDAHQLVGRQEIMVRVHDGGARAARMFACGANDLHGRQRTVAEKRAAVARLLRDPEWGGWSNHVIAETCRVSHTFVAKMRDRLEDEPQERKGRDGRSVKPRPAKPRAARPRPVKPREPAQATEPLPTASAARRTAPVDREPLPAVDPRRGAAAFARLTAARDALCHAFRLIREAEEIVPDPHSAAASEGIDRALQSLFPWAERVVPEDFLANLPTPTPPAPAAERNPVAAPPRPPAERRAETGCENLPKTEETVKTAAAPAREPSARPEPTAGFAWLRPGYESPPEVRAALRAVAAGDRDAIHSMLAQRHAEFSTSPPVPSLATLPNVPAATSRG